MTTDHAQSLRLGQRGTAATPGVQLVAVASLPSVAYRGQIVYALDIDEFRVFDGDAWQIPTAASEGGLQMFVQATAPVADNVGDFWLKDTTYQIYVWDGAVWREVQDPTADAAASAAATAQADALEALGVAEDAQATADGKVTTFYQSLEPALPTEDPQQGDIWFRTSDNRAFIYDSGDFVEIQDQDIVDALEQAGTAQATADQKITSYFQDNPPWPNGTAGHGNDIGDLWYDTNDLNKPYRWDGNWTPVQDGTIAVAQAAAVGAQNTADDALDAATTDGSPPSISPDPFCVSGIGFFILKWDAITNADPVTYQVHISSTLGFTATFNNPATMLGNTSGTQMVVRAGPGPDPAPGVPDPRVLDPDATYYCRVIAFDADGQAAQSNQAPSAVFRVTGIDLAADSVTAANIVAGTLTGELFSATVIMAGTFKTAETGQRIEFGVGGIYGYRSDGSLMMRFSTTDEEEALYDGEIVARGLTVTGGMSIQSVDNEMAQGAAIVMQKGVNFPSAAPQVGYDYAKIFPSTTSLTAAQKTGTDPDWGLGGPFDLVASEVSCVEWRTTNSGHFVFHQIRPNGTRAWYINADGTPKLISGSYFNDVKNYEVWSAFEMTTSSAPKNGVYLVFRWIAGTGTNWYISSPAGINGFFRANTNAPPAIGHNGTDMYIAEVISSTHLKISYYIPTGSGNLPAPTTTYESNAGFNVNSGIGMCNVTHHPSGFDIGSARYLVAERANGSNNKLVFTSGAGTAAIHPGGVTAGSSSWSSANKEAQSFEAPTVNRRGVAWDGTQFWSYHGDGYLYKHTGEFWDPVVLSSTYWARQSYYDGNATGSTHETRPGVTVSYVTKRRSRNFWVPPPVPSAAGTDDITDARLYMARGTVVPAGTSFWLQATSHATSAVNFGALLTSGTNPALSNTFPTAVPAKIKNFDDTLVIDAEGGIKSASGLLYAGTYQIVENPPYYFGYLNAEIASLANDTVMHVTTWVTDTVAGHGVNGNTSAITASSGTYTINKEGMYHFVGQFYWRASNITGSRMFQVIRQTPTVVNIASAEVPGDNDGPQANIVSKYFRCSVGDTIRWQIRQRAAATMAPVNLGATADLSYIQMRYVGP